MRARYILGLAFFVTMTGGALYRAAQAEQKWSPNIMPHPQWSTNIAPTPPMSIEEIAHEMAAACYDMGEIVQEFKHSNPALEIREEAKARQLCFAEKPEVDMIQSTDQHR